MQNAGENNYNHHQHLVIGKPSAPRFPLISIKTIYAIHAITRNPVICFNNYTKQAMLTETSWWQFYEKCRANIPSDWLRRVDRTFSRRLTITKFLKIPDFTQLLFWNNQYCQPSYNLREIEQYYTEIHKAYSNSPKHEIFLISYGYAYYRQNNNSVGLHHDIKSLVIMM